jgi:hypothetical protein
MRKYKLIKWLPKLISIPYYSSLIVALRVNYNKGLEYQKNYKDAVVSYNSANNQTDIDKSRAKGNANYESYEKSLKTQKNILSQIYTFPLALASIIVIDIINKRPTKYIEEPKLAFYPTTDFNNNLLLSLQYKF